MSNENNGWISVEDNQPKLNIPVLTYDKQNDTQMVAILKYMSDGDFCEKEWNYWEDVNGNELDTDYHSITHWQPLPHLPVIK